MAGGKTKRSESNKRYFAAYNPELQRLKRQEKHLKRHPNDKQSKT